MHALKLLRSANVKFISTTNGPIGLSCEIPRLKIHNQLPKFEWPNFKSHFKMYSKSWWCNAWYVFRTLLFRWALFSWFECSFKFLFDLQINSRSIGVNPVASTKNLIPGIEITDLRPSHCSSHPCNIHNKNSKMCWCLIVLKHWQYLHYVQINLAQHQLFHFSVWFFHSNQWTHAPQHVGTCIQLLKIPKHPKST